MAIVPIARETTVSVISMSDSAIDFEQSQRSSDETIAKAVSQGRNPPKLEYQAKQGRDPGSWSHLISVRPGHVITEFVIGMVPPATLTRIEDECRLGRTDERTRELCWRVFIAGLRDIRHGPTSEVTGSDGVKRQGVPKRMIDGIEYVDPDWLARVFVGHLRDVAIEIGLVCWGWQQLTPDSVKN